MISLRVFGMAAALVFLVAGLGGCAIPADPLDNLGPPAAGVPEGQGVNAESEETTTLADVALAVAAGDGEAQVARSYGSTSISTNPDYRPPLTYPPGYNPYNPGDSGAAPGTSTGADSSETPGNGDEPPRSSEGSGTPYSGTLDCLRTESLGSMAGPAEDITYRVTISLDEEGVPAEIPVSPFIDDNDTDLILTSVHYPGDTETHTVLFSDDMLFTMKVTVVSATYTPVSADVVLDIDVAWRGEFSEITASGTHTLEMLVDGEALQYSSTTHYDAWFGAGDDWEEDATMHYDCSGTLTRQ